LKSETIMSDMLYYITQGKHKGLLHIEFQKQHDSNMAERLYEYNNPTTHTTKKQRETAWKAISRYQRATHILYRQHK